MRVCRMDGDKVVLQIVDDYRTPQHQVWGVGARNREQNFALNALMDPEIDLVTLLGTAGTGNQFDLSSFVGKNILVAVNGGGCSGFQYAFDIVPDRAPDDMLIERDGVGVVIDPVSLDYLRGSRIDFVDDLIGQSFKIDNPNATASCGCGTSFSI
jgi:iron-sulfur cluster assembly accessory protein